jgi:hypothetical protein
MLTSSLSKFLPFILLAQGLKGVPKNLSEKMPSSDTLAASDNGVRYFERREDSADNCGFASC